MMKKWTAVLAALVLCLAGAPSWAEEAGEAAGNAAAEIRKCGDYEYIIREDGTAQIIRFTDFYREGEVAVPDKLDDIPVTGIGEYAFDEWSYFPGASNPERKMIPGMIYTNISKEAYFPDGTLNWEHGTPADITINLPSVPEIELNIDLTDSTGFAEGIPFIMDGMFFENPEGWPANMEADIVLPAGLAEPAAAEPEPAVTVKPIIPETDPGIMPEIDTDAPAAFSAITGIVLPDGITDIGFGAFRFCSGVTRVILPDTLTDIGDYAFAGCGSLTGIVLPEGLSRIGNMAFAGCSSLTDIRIPDRVTSIGSNPFDGCEQMKRIDVSPFHPCLTVTGGMLFSKPDKRLILCLDPENSGCVAIPEGTEIIGTCAFSGCGALTSAVIPDSVTVIGNLAFSGCDALAEMTIPESVLFIGNEAFLDCGALTEITIPGSCGSIEFGCFAFCGSLKRVRIMNGLRTIRGYAFELCHALEELVIPESVTEIEWSAFPSSMTVRVVPGSFAEQFCRNNGNQVVYQE